MSFSLCFSPRARRLYGSFIHFFPDAQKSNLRTKKAQPYKVSKRAVGSDQKDLLRWTRGQRDATATKIQTPQHKRGPGVTYCGMRPIYHGDSRENAILSRQSSDICASNESRQTTSKAGLRLLAMRPDPTSDGG